MSNCLIGDYYFKEFEKMAENDIEKELTQEKVLKTKLNEKYTNIFAKKNQQLCVFGYEKEKDINSGSLDSFIQKKSLAITETSDFQVIGWNKNNIYFLKEQII